MNIESSPPPLSEDSAVGSTSSSLAKLDQLNSNNNNKEKEKTVGENGGRPRKTHPKSVVNSDELISAAKLMRRSNVSLISRSIRMNLSCFDDFDVKRFETAHDYFVNYISNGIYKCTPTTVLRPISILWPNNYDKMVEQLGILDAFLLNTEFRSKPVDWMLKRGLTINPTCPQCKEKMELSYQGKLVRWNCQKTNACINYSMPIQRPSFFTKYEHISLDKLLFAVYFWATCTPARDLQVAMNLDSKLIESIWKRMQNVCRSALEKSYPRHRLTDCLDEGDQTNTEKFEKRVPIDLVSIKVNKVFVVCAKHPSSNLVRLGLFIPGISRYNFADLTESWFAHGTHVRIAEDKFLGLNQKRTDLKVHLVDRFEMISTKDGRFDPNSAFGYLIIQLSHVLKDYDSTDLFVENLKLMLAEMQWREIYGVTPFDAFTNIVSHMALYGDYSERYLELAMPISCEETSTPNNQEGTSTSKYKFAEQYYYANVEPVDAAGRVISRLKNDVDQDNLLPPDARVTCHICNRRFACFEFSLHLMAHIEENRRETEKEDPLKRSLIECKHCFKMYNRDHIITHSALLRMGDYHTIKFGCRICCIKLDNRSQYLNHMRQLHFEYETPYRCPSCQFASSFQRDVFIHFQTEHRCKLALICPLCLRSFTIAKPELMTTEKMTEYSTIAYNHIAEHYVLSKSFSCSNCCLCFTDGEILKKHQRRHHNPMEIRSSKEVKIEPYVIANSEEEYCVKASPVELFVANKRPNWGEQFKGIYIDEASNNNDSNNLDNNESAKKTKGKINEFCTATQSDKPPANITNFKFSSEKLIKFLTKFKRADSVIPNQSVILTPDGTPAKCAECSCYITVDHFVAPIHCRPCKYTTLCPRASTMHQKSKHGKDDKEMIEPTAE